MTEVKQWGSDWLVDFIPLSGGIDVALIRTIVVIVLEQTLGQV